MERLISLKSTGKTIFNDTTNPASLEIKGTVNVNDTDDNLQIDSGHVDLNFALDLDNTQSFTLEATINPDLATGSQQNIMESTSLPVSLYIDENGYLNGTANINNELKTLKSSKKIISGKSQSIRFYRDEKGNLNLEIDDKNVGMQKSAGKLSSQGPDIIRIGSSLTNKPSQFKGSIGHINVSRGVSSVSEFKKSMTESVRLGKALSKALGGIHVTVIPGFDDSRKKLQRVKQIMNAAGVERLSDLSTLKISVNTPIPKGKILLAPKKPILEVIDWKKRAKEMVLANAETKKTLLASYLINRNSIETVKSFQEKAFNTVLYNTSKSPVKKTTGKNLANKKIDTEQKHYINKPSNQFNIMDYVRKENDQVSVSDKKILLKNLDATKPFLWPQLSDSVTVLDFTAISQDESVIIAQTLDLTNIQLQLSADVNKLIIIAENVICGDGAVITWRRPGGSTPGRAFNPDLNGLPSYSTAQRAFDDDQNRSGYRGGDATNGDVGTDGAPGRNAPALEMWVKNLTNLPNIDLNGEDGIQGGNGQNGGHGGNGQGGSVGTYWPWPLSSCKKSAGSGGHGGNGGNGGNGGRGGNGGNGGNISIGVLNGTLESTVTAKKFKWKNQGGQPGTGGLGGNGGDGGVGGRSGNDPDYCQNASDGHVGSPGQRGFDGERGYNNGTDGENEFFQFTEDAWEEQLTRPFITSLSVYDVFPGDVLTVRGTRFTSNDRVIFDNTISLTPTINADESLSVIIPAETSGGTKSLFVKRASDNIDSNRVNIRIKPQLDVMAGTVLVPAIPISLTGRAFLPGASVLVNGQSIPATEVSADGKEIKFMMVGTGGQGGNNDEVAVQVRNPDGLESNIRNISKAGVLEIPFRYGVNNFTFNNPNKGTPSWGTFQDTFGSAEVWHETLDPFFGGHPLLTYAFYKFYEHYLIGKGNGGLATGFCTSMSAKVADNLWNGFNNITGITEAQIIEELTAIHGRLLSRESLLHFHDQGRKGTAMVEETARTIEKTFFTGCDRNNSPLLFFIPAGEIWDSGYFDSLNDSHCIFPYKFVYPIGHSGPKLSANGATTAGSLNDVKLYCWDCNHPTDAECFLLFKEENGVLKYEYNKKPKFTLENGITLGNMSNGDYLLADHDMPFSGPFGLTSFVMDFMLSPADLEITDEQGLKAGNFNGKIYSEIPDSHPCYLLEGAYLLPTGKSLIRNIKGNATGKYTYNSIMPDGSTIKLEGIDTENGDSDVLFVNADASQIRLTTKKTKAITITLSKVIGTEIRAMAVSGLGTGPDADLDLTVSPDLSICRIGNRSTMKNVTVEAYLMNKAANKKINKSQSAAVAQNNDLVIAVTDWGKIDLQLDVVPF